MKIFNWVHRKFHNNALKGEVDEFGRDGVSKKQEVMVESQTLLVDGSILTIGTFGLAFHDHSTSYELQTEPESPQQREQEEEFDSDVDNESEENPLVFTTFKHDLDMSGFDVFSSTADYSSDSSEERKMMMIGGGGERTTLADLFLADSQLKSKNNKSQQEAAANSVTTKTQEAVQTKVNGLSFTKKLIPQVAEKSRPIKKLNQMMKKMMNRKIHPELGKHKPADGENNNNMEAKELGSLNESAYLLSIPIPIPIPEVIA